MTIAAVKVASYTTQQRQFIVKFFFVCAKGSCECRGIIDGTLTLNSGMHTHLQQQVPGQHGFVQDIYSLKVCTQAIIPHLTAHS
jgi:hypothetical protein